MSQGVNIVAPVSGVPALHVALSLNKRSANITFTIDSISEDIITTNFLLANGANIDAIDNNGCTAFYCCTRTKGSTI